MSKRQSFPEFPVIMYGVAETPWPGDVEIIPVDVGTVDVGTVNMPPVTPFDVKGFRARVRELERATKAEAKARLAYERALARREAAREAVRKAVAGEP